jgi:hypothetical protein
MSEPQGSELLVQTQLSAVSAGTEMLVYRGDPRRLGERRDQQRLSYLVDVRPRRCRSYQTGPRQRGLARLAGLQFPISLS